MQREIKPNVRPGLSLQPSKVLRFTKIRLCSQLLTETSPAEYFRSQDMYECVFIVLLLLN